MTVRIRVWDLPTRLFHWLLAACVLSLVTTAQLGLMQWHFRLGYAVLTLLLFRLAWGLLGGHWSRFSSFLYSPATLYRFLRGRGDMTLRTGHNPLGALSVFALLLFLLMQVSTGLISDDEIASSGPLTSLVPGTWVSLASSYHRTIGKLVLIVLVSLHVVAILYHLWRKHENLIRPMLSGDKVLPAPTTPSRDDARSRWLAFLLFLICGGLVAALLQVAPAY